MSIRERFDNLEPGQKKIVIWSMVGIVVLLVTLTGYNIRSKKTTRMKAVEKSRSIKLEPDLIQKTMLREQRRQLEALQKTVTALQKNQEKLEKTSEQKLPEIPSADEIVEKPPLPHSRHRKNAGPCPFRIGCLLHPRLRPLIKKNRR
jgi:hypothetical protein